MLSLISLKISCQFSFIKRFVVSPKALSPLNRFWKYACILWKWAKKPYFLLNLLNFFKFFSEMYLEILKVIRRSSVYKCVFPFFTFDFPVHLTCNSGFSREKLLTPMNKINIKYDWIRQHNSLVLQISISKILRHKMPLAII